MEFSPEDDISGPSSISSDQASLCVIPDPEDSSDEDGFIYLDKSSLPATLNLSEQDRTVIVFHSVDEEYPANQDIVCQYIRPDGWRENHKDHICLFKVGWVTKNDAIFMVSLPSPCSDSIGRVIIPVDILPKDTTNLYQFCYMREYALLGASTPFQFTLPKFDSVCCTAIHVPQQPVVEEQASLIAERSANVLSLLKQTSIVTHCNGKTIQDIEYSSPSERHQSPINYRETQQLSDVERSGSQEKSRSNSRSNSDSTYSFLSSMEEPKQLSIATDTGCEVGLTSSQRFPRNNHFSHFASFEQGKDLMKGSSDDPSSCLKNHFGEINEEKKWFQEEYHSLLATTRKYAEDLATERSEKISLNGHLAELAISNKMLCSENARLNEELERRRQYETEQLKKHQLEKNELKSSLQNVSLENLSLLEEVRYLQSQSKLEKESDISLDKSSLEAQCDDFKKQDSDLSSRLSDFEVIRKCLETELEEELRAGQERDCYIAQLEQVKVNNLQMASNWLASTPNSSADGNTLLEMEENVNSTLEALECALKEMEVLRSRKAALNRVNRILRDEFVQKRYEWKVKMEKQAVESDSKVAELQRQIFDLQCTANAGRLSQCASYQYVGKWNEEQSQQSLVDQNRDVAGAIESTKNEISCLDIQKAELEHDHTLQKFRKDRGVTKVINSTLLKNLQDARDEYKKLYTEKVRVEEKLLRLQQKVKTKKLCRAHQEISDAAPTRDNFLDNPVSSWWATIDELM